MIEIVSDIKAFAGYYNTLIKEIERITPIKRTVVSVFKSDCGYNYYEDEQQDVVDESKPISEIPRFPPLQEFLERKKQFEADCDKMILSGEDVLFRSLLRLFKRLQYYPADFQFVDKKLYDEKIIVDMVFYLGVHIIGNYESIDVIFDSIEERRALLLQSSQNVKQKEKGQNSFTFPKELDSDEAKVILQKAIIAGLCDNTYKWLKSKALLAYFADKVSEYMNLGKGEYDGKAKISWKPFEILFRISGLSGAKRDYQKTGTMPAGYNVVNKLFE